MFSEEDLGNEWRMSQFNMNYDILGSSVLSFGLSWWIVPSDNSHLKPALIHLQIM